MTRRLHKLPGHTRSRRHFLDRPDVELIVRKPDGLALIVAMLGATLGGCGDGSREGAVNETRLAVMCGEISQDETDQPLERETREWCLRAFRDTGDAEVRDALKAIRSSHPPTTPKP